MPLALNVTCPASAATASPMVKLFKANPPFVVNVPVKLIGAPATNVCMTKLVVFNVLDEIPLTNPVLSIMTPPMAWEVRVLVTPP